MINTVPVGGPDGIEWPAAQVGAEPGPGGSRCAPGMAPTFPGRSCAWDEAPRAESEARSRRVVGSAISTSSRLGTDAWEADPAAGGSTFAAPSRSDSASPTHARHT